MSKLCVINGASGGIGSSIACELSRDNDLYLLGRNEAKLKHIKNELQSVCNVEYSKVDVCQKNCLQHISDALKKQGRAVSCVVNSVGIVPVGGIMDISEEEWHQTLQVSFMSAVRLVKAFSPLMQEHGGSIVLINGVFAIQPDPNFVVSSAITGALRNFAKAVSKDLSKYKIRVNCILPGATKTDLWNGISQSLNTDLTELTQAISESNPLKRIANPEDISKAVSYLCSDSASYINGASLVIDGGSSMAMS
jgi:NAD(P)-dependent dehydrogenase (short-subunit alcohol dehydrogenase family)